MSLNKSYKSYTPRKNTQLTLQANEPIEFLALDWYECDLPVEIPVERKECYLNQEHSKQYTIFIFGVTSKGQSVCLKVKNYFPYMYIQVPDNYNDKQIQEFIASFDSSKCEDYDLEEIAEYENAIASKDYKFTENFKQNSRYYKDSIVAPQIDNKTLKYE